jgi:hypothetical protein
VADLGNLLQLHRSAVDDFLQVAEGAAERWATPRAPGKWSAQQVVEHVAMTYEESAAVIEGRPTKLPTLPALLRPLARFVFNRTLKTGKFPKAKTTKALDPTGGPANPVEARTRLEAAVETFSKAATTRGEGAEVVSGAFGKISLEDYVRFTELHTRHHAKQIPVTT